MSPIQGLSGFGGGIASKLLGGAGGGSSSSFTFRYHMYGSTMGDLQVYVYNTTAASLVGPFSITYDAGTGTVISGEQHTSQSATWGSATVDLSDASGVTGYLAFKFRPGSNYFADAALDDMSLTLPDGTVVDLDPDLFRSDSIQNWQSARFQDKTTDTFPIDGGSVVINAGNSYNWKDCAKNSSTLWFGQYEDRNTGSGNTGPNADASGSITGYYIYFEASSPNWNYTAWLRTKNQYTF